MQTKVDLPKEFELSFYLGEIVRNDVYAEHEMRVLWNFLDAAGLRQGLSAGDYKRGRERDFGRLIPQVRKLLSQSAVPPEFRRIALDVIETTHVSHTYRAKLVHDLLVQSPWDGNTVRSAFGTNPPRSVDELRQCAAELKRSSWRLRGVWIIAPHWVGGPLDVPVDDEGSLRSWTRVAMGHIEDNPHTVIGTQGDCPEPPSGFRSEASTDTLSIDFEVTPDWEDS